MNVGQAEMPSLGQVPRAVLLDCPRKMLNVLSSSADVVTACADIETA